MVKEIPESSRLEFLEKFLANKTLLFSDTKDNTSGSLNKRYSRFTFVDVGSDRLFYFISMC